MSEIAQNGCVTIQNMSNVQRARLKKRSGGMIILIAYMHIILTTVVAKEKKTKKHICNAERSIKESGEHGKGPHKIDKSDLF